MKTRYVPGKDDVVAELIIPRKTKAGLEIPASFGESYPRCRILAIGPRNESTYAEGDVVLADAARGYNIAEKTALFPMEAILCKVEGHSDDDTIEVEPSPLVRPAPIDLANEKMNRARRRNH